MLGRSELNKCCVGDAQGGMTQMRFQPRQGRLLAAAAENVVSIFDVESETCVHTLQVRVGVFGGGVTEQGFAGVKGTVLLCGEGVCGGRDEVVIGGGWCSLRG